MDPPPPTATLAVVSSPSSSGGGGGGPAPFLLKTYDMVDDASTKDIVSWSSKNNSFIVWNPPEFSRLLLPTYFKHSNFSSFIRQLNTYGFRKIDSEKWEFSNEDFVKDQKHLLKNIHRRKPIHSHSHPPVSQSDPERATFDEEIDKLSHEKAELEAKISKLKKQQSIGKKHMEGLSSCVEDMENRQEELLTFLEKAVTNSTFVEILVRKIEAMDLSAYNKKRRLPEMDCLQPAIENNVNSHNNSIPESGNIIQQDFSSKLRLELSPAASDINLLSHSTQSSNEDGVSPQRKISEGEPKMRTDGPPCAPETLDLSDTGTSFMLRMDSTLQQKMPINDSPRLHPLHQMSLHEGGDNHISCQLNLSLASSLSQVDKNQYSGSSNPPGPEISMPAELRLNINRESDFRVPSRTKNHSDQIKNPPPLSETPSNNCLAPGRVNDVFWEQFLTERPGSTDDEEANSTYRANPYDERERSPHGLSNAENIEQLTL